MGMLVRSQLTNYVNEWIPPRGRVCVMSLKLLDTGQCLIKYTAQNARAQYQEFVE